MQTQQQPSELTLYQNLNSGLISLSEPEQQILLKHLCLTDLFYLLAFVLRRDDCFSRPEKAEWLIARCREVEAEPNNCLDLWAREHYKSTIITFALTIQDILRNPEITVGIFSHTAPNARKFLRQIKQEFEQNLILKRTFENVLWAEPHKQAPKWSEDDGIVVKRNGNPKEATVTAHGLVDGLPSGPHYMLRVYDDTVTKESVNTPEQIKKTTEAWEMSDNLGAEGGTQRYIGTRYSLYDTYSEIIKRGVKVRKYTATHNSKFDGKPVLFTPEYWAHKLKTQSRKTLAAQMMQNPLADADAIFQIDWLRAFEVRPRLCNIVILCDPSKGRHRNSDRTAIAVIAICQGEKKFLVDGYCHRMSLSQRWVAIRDLYKKWSAVKGVQSIHVGYERYGKDSDDEYFEERMRLEKSTGCPQFVIKELNWVEQGKQGSQSKGDRVERLEPDFRNARFFLPLAVYRDGRAQTWRIDMNIESNTYQSVVWDDFKGLTKMQREAMTAGSDDLLAKALKRVDNEKQIYDLTEVFIEEFLHFPFNEHDDLIDATSRVYDMEVQAPKFYDKNALNPAVYPDS